MKTELEWEQKILEIKNTIHNEFPELVKFISKMPTNDLRKDEKNIQALDNYYHSLNALVTEYAKTHKEENATRKTEIQGFIGYPSYPPSEDIYAHSKEESEIDPEDISKMKTRNEKQGTMNEQDFEADMSGDDLDVPGAELDDQKESIGSEDEENNYYSLGGDNHNNLEEDHG